MLLKGRTRIAAASDEVYQLLVHGQPVVKSIYIQTPMNYFYSNRTHTVFELPKQIMTLPISRYTNNQYTHILPQVWTQSV
jgi:hypothetical protein